MNMSLKIKIEKRKEYLVATFTGEATFQDIGKRFKSLAESCQVAKKSKLLIDFSPINSVPTFSDRFRLGENAVVFAEFGIKVAVVGPPGMIDPGRLGELVARNRGVNGHVFSDLAAARQWLLQESSD
jgi:hypothetical protein